MNVVFVEVFFYFGDSVVGCIVTVVDALHDVENFVICYAGAVQCFDDCVSLSGVL